MPEFNVGDIVEYVGPYNEPHIYHGPEGRPYQCVVQGYDMFDCPIADFDQGLGVVPSYPESYYRLVTPSKERKERRGLSSFIKEMEKKYA